MKRKKKKKKKKKKIILDPKIKKILKLRSNKKKYLTNLIILDEITSREITSMNVCRLDIFLLRYKTEAVPVEVEHSLLKVKKVVEVEHSLLHLKTIHLRMLLIPVEVIHDLEQVVV